MSEAVEQEKDGTLPDLESVADLEKEPKGGAEKDQVHEDEETIVSIGEETPPSEEDNKAPEWVRELRRKQRETAKENGELKKKLEALTAAPTVPTLGKKPTLEDCDYDADKFESELAAWFDHKRKADDEEAKAKQAEEAAKADWNSKLENYGKAKAELKLKDFDDAESDAMETLSITQQGIILQGSKNPALLIYALGKDKKEGQKLASIKDPVQFTWAAATLEATELKVTKKAAPPPPERQINGTGRISGTVDSTLERLREDAAKSGDYSKVMQYKAQQRKKQ